MWAASQFQQLSEQLNLFFFFLVLILVGKFILCTPNLMMSSKSKQLNIIQDQRKYWKPKISITFMHTTSVLNLSWVYIYFFNLYCIYQTRFTLLWSFASGNFYKMQKCLYTSKTLASHIPPIQTISAGRECTEPVAVGQGQWVRGTKS